MKVTEILDQTGWDRLHTSWNPLLESSASATTFLTWEWLRSWWSSYGNGSSLNILVATDDDGELRGIAPLRRETVRRWGRPFQALAFIGDGSNDSDYLDFIVTRGFERPVVTAFFEHVAHSMREGVIVRLNDLPDASPNLRILKDLAQPNYLWVEEPVPCATVRLPETWDEYLSTLRPRFRTKIRSVLRSLESRPSVRFGFCTSQEDIHRLLPVLFDLHTRRWKVDGQSGVFGWESKRRFYASLSPMLLASGALRFSWLEWNERVLACQYGFVHRHTYLHLQEGYEPACEHWNVGIGLRAWTMRQFLAAGVREYDFLAGVGRHKTDWGSDVKQSQRIVVATRSVSNQLFCHGPEWTRDAKETLKRVIPEPVLALRRRRLRQRPQESATSAADSRVRRFTAESYFRLGLPAAARLVRQRYELSVPATQHGRRFARRRRPAGRILYYHRVNDDGDPFFPSTRVSVFERHMRFVSRYYRVVPLRTLIDHLQSASPETVLSVTFDDGYQDNYTHAFPILERYGIPATIFLTTGGIDSRDPMWFEILAGALKTSSREFIDIEVDLPRRFWLRTPDERLHANSQLFTTLRQRGDDDRRRLLEAILRELAPPAESARRDAMLTWEQVRWLQRRAIDFGGHTVTHPFVSRLSPERAAWEISECKNRIETELQAPVLHFAYPSGREEDFAPWSKDVVRAAGYRAAVTTIWGLNYDATDRLELRRGGPWEEDEALFAYKMDWYHLVNG